MSSKKSSKVDLLKIIKEASDKKVSYVFAGVTVAVSIVLIITAIRPTIITITRIRSEIEEKERTDDALEAKINALTELDNEYVDLQDSFDGISLVFPTEGDFSLFMANIDAVSSRNGFILTGLSFSDYKDDNPINTSVLDPWSVRLGIEGKKGNIVDFLKDLESLPMYPVIESISFTDDAENDEAISFSISMRISHVPINNFYD